MVRYRRRGRRTAIALLTLLLAGAAFAGTVAVIRLRARPPLPQVNLTSATTLPVLPSPAPKVLSPPTGSFALEVSGPRLLSGGPVRVASLDDTAPHPIASVAKALTALVVLQLRPLGPGQDGPEYRITAADVADYRAAQTAGGSTVFVSEGETFTERQLLLALMLPSGNNIADTLARWAAGSREAFLVKANQEAQTLGMTSTHLADPSGFDAATVASTTDLVALGRAVLAEPALAAIVATKEATLPDGTAMSNLDTALFDVPGWLGIKTGNSDPAGGCLLFAARRAPDGDPDPADAVTVIGAVLGQHSTASGAGPADDRAAALYAAKTAVNSTLSQLVPLRATELAPELSGTVEAPWGASTPVALGTPVQPHPWVARKGTTLDMRLTRDAQPAPLAAGAAIGRLEARAGSILVATWPVQVLRDVPAPDWTWRLQHD